MAVTRATPPTVLQNTLAATHNLEFEHCSSNAPAHITMFVLTENIQLFGLVSLVFKNCIDLLNDIFHLPLKYA